jgi:hypothetical protein
LPKRRAASWTHNFVSAGFKVASDTLRLIALNFDLSAANGTSTSKIATDATRQFFDFRYRKVRRQLADHDNGFPSTLDPFSP